MTWRFFGESGGRVYLAAVWDCSVSPLIVPSNKIILSIRKITRHDPSEGKNVIPLSMPLMGR
jgi:hypothetical protein